MELRLGPRTFADTDLALMAVVNRTRDSFYDRSRAYTDGEALESVERVVEEGADLVDVGGVRAGYGDEVTPAEEIDRVAGFVATVRDRHPDLVISVDTWRAEVARAVCEAGAHLLNDAWAGAEPELAEVAAGYGAGVVCSHSGGLPPRTDPHRQAYDDVTADVVRGVTGLAARALAAGIRRDGIVVDPTHDFGKNTRQSLRVTRELGALVATGYPVLVAVSRKDFVGETLDLPVDERLEGTLATVAVSAWLGARLFRVHDVRAARRTLDMVAAIRGTRPPAVSRRGLA